MSVWVYVCVCPQMRIDSNIEFTSIELHISVSELAHSDEFISCVTCMKIMGPDTYDDDNLSFVEWMTLSNRFPHLRSITLRGYNESTSSPNSTRMSALLSLNLEHIHISKSDSNIEIDVPIDCSMQLTTLKMYSVRVSRLAPTVRYLTKLRSLSLAYNGGALPIQDFSVIASITSLEELNLSENDINEWPTWLEHLINLTELNLYTNCITAITHYVPAKLEKLHLGSNNISNCEGLSKCQSLTQLIMYRNALSEFPSSVLHLHRLQHLDLSNNSLKSIPIQITELSALIDLDVQLTSISELPVELGSMKYLKTIKADDNPLLDPTVNRLTVHRHALVEYLRQLWTSKRSIRRVQLIMLGNAEAGKTTIVQTMMNSSAHHQRPQPSSRTQQVCIYNFTDADNADRQWNIRDLPGTTTAV